MDNKIRGTDTQFAFNANAPLPGSGSPAVTPPTLPIPEHMPPPTKHRLSILLKITAALLLLVMLGVVAFVVYRSLTDRHPNENAAVSTRFPPTQIPLTGIGGIEDTLALLGSRSLVINGPLVARGNFVLSPSEQPSNASAGQIYYNQDSNQLFYFNGSEFVPVASTNDVVTDIAGAGGSVTVGTGLGAADGTLSNTGVLSLQGQTGAVSLVAGPGIAVDGTTISSTGVLSVGGFTGALDVGAGLSVIDGSLSNTGVHSVASGSPNVTVTDDGAGNVTIGFTGGGTGTVDSPGGTPGRLAVFTGAQTIADSIMAESGATITVNGALDVIGATTLDGGLGITGNASVSGALNLGTALSVGNGGTGATALALNGVVIGQGTNALTAVVAGGAGLCFMSTGGAPTWQACPGGGGVTSLNGTTGALSIGNTTEAGGVITVDDASTTQKGIAQFDSDNFSAAGGVIDTIQNINTGASPTFNGLSLASNLAVGGTQTTTGLATFNGGLILQTGDTLNINGDAVTDLTGNGLQVTTGALTLALQANKGLEVDASGLSLIDCADTQVLKYNASNQWACANDNGGSGSGVDTVGVIDSQAKSANGAVISATTIFLQTADASFPGLVSTAAQTFAGAKTFSSTLAVGTLGSANSDVVICRNTVTNQLATCNSTFATTTDLANYVGLQAVTPGTPQTGHINVSGTVIAGNFSGNGAGLTNLSASNIAAGTLNDARLSSNVALLNAPANFTAALQQGGDDVCTAAGNCTGLGQAVDSLNTLQGDLTLAGTAGQIAVNDNSTDTITLSLDPAVTLQGNTFNGASQLVQLNASTQLPAVSGALLTNLNATNITSGTLANARLQGGGALTVTAGTGLTGGGSVALGGSTTLNVAYGSTASTAVQGNTQLTVTAGTNVTGGGTITLGTGGNVTVSVADSPIFAGDVVVQGGNLTLGVANTQTGSLTLANDTSAFTGTLQIAALSQDTTYTLPDPGGATATICLSTGNCAGAGGGITGSGSTNQLAKFTGGGTIGDSSISDNGSVVTTSTNMIVQGGSVTVGTASQLGSLILHNGSGENTTLQAGASSSNLTFVLPTGTGTQFQCLKKGSGDQLIWDDCEGGSGGGGVTSLNSLTGSLTIQGTTNQIAVNDNGSNTITLSLPQNIHAAATPTFGGLTLNGALTMGTNNITGTNFSVAGATGAITSGLINNQTISSSANFTGSVTVANGLTVTTGDLAVNSGDITSTGALAITPGGTLTLGATGQSLVMQGDATTGLAAHDGANSTTLEFTLPTGTNTITLPDASGEVCLTTGNCTGVGAAVDSLNTLQGDLTLEGTTGQIDVADNGTDTITLSLDANVTLQGNAFNGPSQLVQLDGSGALPAVSGANLTNLNASNISSGTLANARLVNAGALTVTAGTGLTGGGNVALGGSTTLNVAYGSSAGTAVQGNTQLTVTAGNNITGGGTVTLGTGGSITVNVASSPTFAGNVVVQGGDLTLGVANTQTGSLILANGTSAFEGLLQVDALGQDTAYTLPDPGGATAEICLTTGNCAGAGGGITGGGTNNTIAKFTGSGTIGDSSLTDDGTAVVVGANLNVTGNADVSGTLAVGTADAFQVNAAGAVTAVGLNSGTGLIQGTGGLTVGGTITLSSLTSGFLEVNGSGVVSVGTINLGADTAGDYVATLGALTGLGTTGNSGEGSTPTISVLYGATANTAVQGNTSLTCPSGTGNLTGGGTAITLGSGGTCAALNTIADPTFATSVTTPIVQNAGLTLAATGANSLIMQTNGSTRLTIASDGNVTATGSMTLQGGVATLGTTSQQGSLTLHDGNGQTATITMGSALAANTALAIPTGVGANDTLCLETLANCTAAGDFVELQASSPGTPQTGHLNISGSGLFGTSIQTPSVTSAAALAITGGTTLTLQSTGANAATLDSGTTGAVNIGTGSNAKTITIGNATGATAVTVLCGTGSCGFGNNATAHATTVGSATGASATTLQGGSGGVNIESSGQMSIDASTGMFLFSSDFLDINAINDIAIGANGNTTVSASDTASVDGDSVTIGNTTASSVSIGNASATVTINSKTSISVNNTTTNDPPFKIIQNGSGDASFELQDTNGKSFFFGMDASDGGAFKIASSASAAPSSVNEGHISESCCNSSTSGNNEIWATKVTIGGTGGIVSSISLYTSTVDGSLPSGQVALYTHDATNDLPQDLVATSSEQTLTAGWNTFSISATVSASTTYWLAYNYEGSSTLRMFGSVGGARTVGYAQTFGGWPAPAGDTGSTTFVSAGTATPLYMTITPAGSVDSFDGTNLLKMSENGAITLQNSANSTTAFRVLNASSVALFAIDTSANRVYIGNPVADSTGALLVLDTKNTATDPSGTNGAMYYNSNAGKFRCYENGGWKDCVGNSRIATAAATSDSSTFTTTETQVMSVTAPLVNGQTYRVRFIGALKSTVANDRVTTRLHQDNTAGADMQNQNTVITTTTGTTSGYPVMFEAEYTAVATGNKTFVVTGQRVGGSGDINLEAGSDHPSYIYVDYVR